VQLGEGNGGGKPRRASLLQGMKPDDVTLDVAVALLKLPRPLGLHPETGKVIEAGVGRFGPYVHHDTDYRSLAAGDDVLTVDLDRALELLSQPKIGRGARQPAEPLRELGPHPADGQPVILMAGRFGPYVKHGDINATLPRGTKPDTLTLDQAVALIAAKAARGPAVRPSRPTKRRRAPSAESDKTVSKKPKRGAKSKARTAAKTKAPTRKKTGK
jgi:DNA topoisomerase-1